MTLSLEEKVGQMLVFGWQRDSSGGARRLNDHARLLIEDIRVGGVVLMGRNIGRESETRALLDSLRELARSTGLEPLLICTDQEGGRVSRFAPPAYPEFPSALSIGQTGDISAAASAASEIGALMKEVGVNWVLMPVLDVNNNPGNQVIGDRSYGSDPRLVAEMGSSAVHGLQDVAGVLSCGKHFPGHGDTAVDSHFDLPVIDRSLESMQDVELLPFRAAIRAGIGSIMTTHILFPALDPNLPATLSPAIISGLLRNSFGYDGLVVTDCLEMEGVAAKWGSPEAAVLAAIAGADMLLACHTAETQVEIKSALLLAVEMGRLSEARIDEANVRIASAKSRWAEAA